MSDPTLSETTAADPQAPAAAPTQPPVDNAHVEPGATPFTPAGIAANAPTDGLAEILPPAQTPIESTAPAPASDAVEPAAAPTTPPPDATPAPATVEGPAADHTQDPVPAPQGGSVAQPAAVASPFLIASICIYREPDGKLSLVRENVPQAFFEVGQDLLTEAKAYLHNRIGSYVA